MNADEMLFRPFLAKIRTLEAQQIWNKILTCVLFDLVICLSEMLNIYGNFFFLYLEREILCLAEQNVKLKEMLILSPLGGRSSLPTTWKII